MQIRSVISHWSKPARGAPSGAPSRPYLVSRAPRGTLEEKRLADGVRLADCSGRVWSPRLAPTRFSIWNLLQFVKLDVLPLIIQ